MEVIVGFVVVVVVPEPGPDLVTVVLLHAENSTTDIINNAIRFSGFIKTKILIKIKIRTKKLNCHQLIGIIPFNPPLSLQNKSSSSIAYLIQSSPMSDFTTITEHEIHRAIAPNPVQLTGQAPVKRYDAEAADGLRPIHIITLAINFMWTDKAKSRLLALRDQLVTQRELLLLIAESTDARYESDLTEVISEEIAIESPYFMGLQCYRDHDYQTTIDGMSFEPLQRVIQEIRWGGIVYNGPVTGRQAVNVELIKDSCWKCQQHMRTVTGLVFPDRQLPAWDSEDWLYYSQLVALGSLPDRYALPVQAFAKELNNRDPLVTPVQYRYSRTTQSSYWAAVCLGKVTDLKHPPHYTMGWITEESGVIYFFHKSNEDLSVFNLLGINTTVNFSIKKNGHKWLAYDLTIAEDV